MWRQNAAPVSGGRGIKLHFRFQKLIERVFFGGRTTAWSRRVSFWLGNTIVIFGLFFVLTQLLLYRWTGGLYAAGDGFRLDGVFGGLDNSIPFVPQMAVFYVYTYYPWVFFTMLFFTFLDYEQGLMFGVSLFVKQHYIVDEIAGMALGFIVSYSVYRFLSNRATERG